jgi:hypothetical protein
MRRGIAILQSVGSVLKRNTKRTSTLPQIPHRLRATGRAPTRTMPEVAGETVEDAGFREAAAASFQPIL